MKVLTSKIVNGKKMFLIEDNNPQGKVFAQDGKPINKENISNYNPYYVDVKGLNASESTKTNLTPATKITPQEIKKIKESPTNVGNIKIKEAQEKAQRLKEAEEAYKKRKAGVSITPELLAQETQAIGDKISLQNIPGVGQYIPDMLDVTGGLGSMASNLGALPLNLNRGNYGQALLSVATPLATGALAGIGTQNTGQFINNVINPLGVDITRLALNNPIWKKKVLSEIAEGNKWSQKWYSHPLTKERYDNFVYRGNPYLGEKAALENSNLMSHFENVDFDEPLFQSINLPAKNHATVARNNYEKLLNEGKLTEGTTELLDQNRNVLGRYSYIPNDAKIDILHPSFLFNKFKPKATTIHENIHALTRGDKALLPNAKRNFKAAFGNQGDEYDKYLTEPTEIHARIGEIRNHFDLTPESLIDDKHVGDIIKQGLKGKTPVDKRFFELIKDKEQFKWLMNNAPTMILPIAGAGALQEKKYGGTIKVLDTKIENNKKYYLINE